MPDIHYFLKLYFILFLLSSNLLVYLGNYLESIGILDIVMSKTGMVLILVDLEINHATIESSCVLRRILELRRYTYNLTTM